MRQFLIHIFFLALTLSGISARAQQTVSGVVKDAYGGAPLEGVVVNLVGSKGVSDFTDTDGRFSLPISSKDEVALEFAFADYRTRRVFLHGCSEVNISLVGVDRPAKGEQTVKTEAGSQLRRDLSGSSVTLTGDQIRERGYLSLDKALQGMVPGMLVESHSGASATGGMMTIRGTSGMSTTAKPLIVLDGVIYETNTGGLSAVEGYTYNPLANIRLRDVEQVTVVKDGMAGIYGSLASNGVIYVYTSESNVKKTRVDFSANLGWIQAPRTVPVLDAKGFRSFALEQALGSGLSYSQVENEFPYLVEKAEGEDRYRYGQDTDWQDLVYRNGMMSAYSANIEGGDNIASYNLSVGYNKNEDVVENTDYESFDFRMNARIQMLKSLVVRPQVSLSKVTANIRPEGLNGTTNPTFSATLKSPLMGVYKRSEKGIELPFYDEVGGFGMSNPVSLVDNGVGLHENFRVRAGLKATQRIYEDLDLDVDLTADLFNLDEGSFVPRTGGVPQLEGQAKSVMQNSQKQFYSILGEARLRYAKTIANRHNVGVQAGTRIRTNRLEEELATDINSPSDKFTVIGRGDGNYRQLKPENGNWNMASFYGRAKYSYLDKYYLDAGVNMDISSRFTKSNRMAYFPFASAAWRVSAEPFLASAKWLDDFKIRASYGFTGNDDIGYYSSGFYYVARPYFNISGLVRGGIPNTDLKWEVSKQLDLGVDFTLFDNRVRITADYYKTTTEDLITAQQLDTFYGTNLLLSNSGSLENTGFELAVNVDVYRGKDFSLDLGASVATNENKVVELGDNASLGADGVRFLQTQIEGGEIISREGDPINTFYGYKTAGVIATAQEAERLNLRDRHDRPFKAGDMAFVDLNGDNVIDESDKTDIGSPLPEFFGAFTANARYKKLSLNLVFDYAYGHEIFNYKRKTLESMVGYANQSEAVGRRWKEDGQVTDIPKASFGDPAGNARFSDRWIEDGSFLRLRNVAVSYDFDIRNKLIRSLRAYVSASNIFTLTEYLGQSPDVSYSNDVMQRGVDYGRLPQLRSVMMGVKLGI
ncbi:SusC/RagA family TonB-linked outer membrane protein [Fulvitalea axinellae]|uniref:SusC/RagA family TonB-linked outer membrane protein n=1 Tax=Fulvitalea axinellae TaxID=1182444 RepID=A0AAU9CK70_9BACT|nr:SusC/RagA family TonB-linked outer membrane protein [Fulvitalea axinellae]